MANIDNKLPENVPGNWYTDDNCIICGLCGELAPTLFRTREDGQVNIVYHQPSTPEEAEAALEAMDACPVEAIGNDGEAD